MQICLFVNASKNTYIAAVFVHKIQRKNVIFFKLKIVGNPKEEEQYQEWNY